MTDVDPFDFGPTPAPTHPASPKPGRAFTGHRRKAKTLFEQALDVASSGMDADSLVLARSAKKRRKQPNFLPYAKAYWEGRGYRWELREFKHTIFMAGMPVTYTLDWLGFIDATVSKGPETIGIQVCSQSGITAHIRKMCSDEKMKGAYRTCGVSRRQNLVGWFLDGRRMLVMGYHQPDGFGTKWVAEIREVTAEDIETVMSGGRIKRK